MECKCGSDLAPAVTRRGRVELSYGLCRSCGRNGDWVLREKQDDDSSVTLLVGVDALNAYNELVDTQQLPEFERWVPAPVSVALPVAPTRAPAPAPAPAKAAKPAAKTKKKAPAAEYTEVQLNLF